MRSSRVSCRVLWTRCKRGTKWNCVALGASGSVTARRGKDATPAQGTRSRFRPKPSHHLLQGKPSKRRCKPAQHLQRVPTVLLPTGQRWSGEGSAEKCHRVGSGQRATGLEKRRAVGAQECPQPRREGGVVGVRDVSQTTLLLLLAQEQ